MQGTGTSASHRVIGCWVSRAATITVDGEILKEEQVLDAFRNALANHFLGHSERNHLTENILSHKRISLGGLSGKE